MEEKNIVRIRKVVALLILLIFIGVFIKMLPIFLSLTTEEGRDVFENKVLNLGIRGGIVIICLEICKIMLVFLPGEPIELVAGMCYGPIWGLLIIYAGVIISNILIIFSVKKYGVTLVKDIVPENKISKIENIINKNPYKSEVTLFVLYFLPALPKDFITYVASLLPISRKKIVFISIVARFPAVFSSVLVGNKILDGDVKGIILIYAVTYIISALIAFVYKLRGGKTNE